MPYQTKPHKITSKAASRSPKLPVWHGLCARYASAIAQSTRCIYTVRSLVPSQRHRPQQPQHADVGMDGGLVAVLRQAGHQEQVLPHRLRAPLLHLVLQRLPRPRAGFCHITLPMASKSRPCGCRFSLLGRRHVALQTLHQCFHIAPRAADQKNLIITHHVSIDALNVLGQRVGEGVLVHLRSCITVS